MERPNILENGNIKSVHLWQGHIICFWEEKFLSLEQKKNEQGRLQLWIYLRKWQPTPVFLPGKSHGWRSPVGYSPGGRKELDTIEQLHFTLLHFTSQVGRRASQVVLVVKNPPANAGDISGEGVRSLGGEDPLEESRATDSSNLAWRIPWTEEPGGLWSKVPKGIRHDWNDLAHTHRWGKGTKVKKTPFLLFNPFFNPQVLGH